MQAIHVRPIRPTDAPALEAFYSGLSEESRRLRFFAVTAGLSHAQSAAFCATDHAHREGYVATTAGSAEGGPERIVGHVCLEPAGADRAEVAIAVADAFQRRGIGRRLMRAAVAWAERRGVATLTATMLATNPGIHGLIRSLGLPSRRRASDLDTTALDIAIDVRPAIAA